MSQSLQAESSSMRAPSVQELGRVDHWWYSKVAPVLAVSYCAALLYRVAAWPTARSILLIAFVGLCAGSYGHLVNDAFDIEVDRKSGKRNHMASFAPWQRFALCAAMLALGFAPAIFVSYSRTSLLLLGLEYLLPTIYSVPPLRLKGRGALGLLCDSLGAHLVPCLYVISVLAHETASTALLHTPVATAFVWLVSVWAFCLGVIGIVTHQFEDRENDLRSGIRTFATGRMFEDVRRVMNALYIVELLAFAAIAALLWRIAPLLTIAATVYAVAVVLKLSAHRQHYRHVREEATIVQWWQLSHAFYEAYFPLAVAVQCAWVHPALVVFPVAQTAAFAHTFRRQLPELRELRTHLLLRGRLDVDDSAMARVKPLFWPPWGARIDIAQGGQARWNIRVARPGFRIRAGTEYALRLRVRADNARSIMVGVWQDHAPWGGAGLCEELQALPQWQTVRRTFVAAGDHRQAYLGLWLGGDATAVELRGYSLRRVFRLRRQER